MRHKMLLNLARDRQEEIRREAAEIRSARANLPRIQLKPSTVVFLIFAVFVLLEILK